jgi:glutamate--cysteine ligase
MAEHRDHGRASRPSPAGETDGSRATHPADQGGPTDPAGLADPTRPTEPAGSPGPTGDAPIGAAAAGGLTEREPLTIRAARDWAVATALLARPPGNVGIELEWFVVDLDDPTRSIPLERTRAALAATAPALSPATIPVNGSPVADGTRLPGGSRVTFEPGGQLELSGPPLPLVPAISAMRADVAAVRAALGSAGLGLAALGADPVRPPIRVLREPRYAAMARYFAWASPSVGPLMMCSTASVQVNLNAGEGTDRNERFARSHALAAVLTAMFAASPAVGGRLTGWSSSRQAIWAALDPTRSRPVAPAGRHCTDPAVAWTDYLLAAHLMVVRGRAERFEAVTEPVPFARWLDGGGPAARPATLDDLAYHATTVFPPVRPRGWLELRYLDAQPHGRWPVAVAVTTALMDDPVAAPAAAELCAPLAAAATKAARHGLADGDLRRAALGCAALALDALPRLGADAALVAEVEHFVATFVERGLCPADELRTEIDALGGAGVLCAQARAGADERPAPQLAASGVGAVPAPASPVVSSR